MNIVGLHQCYRICAYNIHEAKLLKPSCGGYNNPASKISNTPILETTIRTPDHVKRTGNRRKSAKAVRKERRTEIYPITTHQ